MAFFAVLHSIGQSKSYSHANGRTRNIAGIGLYLMLVDCICIIFIYNVFILYIYTDG